jgi:hypothetical protein
MKRLPDQIKGEYKAHLPIPPELHASGSWDEEKTRFWKRQSNNLQRAERHYRKLGEAFFNSYWESKEKLAVNLRDLAINQAVVHSLVNCQYRRGKAQELTPAALTYWKGHDFSAFWHENKDYRDYYYAGFLGSVAFSLLNRDPIPSDTDVISIIKRQQETFWRSLDLHKTPLERKYDTLLRRMGYSLDIAEKVQGELAALYDLDVGDPNFDLKQRLLSSGILRGEVTNLAWRIPRIQVRSPLISVFKTAAGRGLLSVDAEWIVKQLTKFLRLSPPAGIDTVLQALIVDAYILLATFVDSSSNKYQPLSEWEDNLSDKDVELLYGYLTFIHDALYNSSSILTLDPSRQYVDRLVSYYKAYRKDPNKESWLRLTDRELKLPKFGKTLRPPKGKPLVILSVPSVVRDKAKIEFRSIGDSVEGYLCEGSRKIDPIPISITDKNEILSVALEVDSSYTFVVTPDPIRSLEDLKDLSFHSAIMEAQNVDSEPPYRL